MNSKVCFYIIRSTEIPKINVEVKKQRLVNVIRNIIFEILENEESTPNIYISSTFNLFNMDTAIKKLFEGYDLPINIKYYYSYEVYNSILEDIGNNSRILNGEQEGQSMTMYLIDLDAVAIENINNLKNYHEEKQKTTNKIQKGFDFLKIQNI